MNPFRKKAVDSIIQEPIMKVVIKAKEGPMPFGKEADKKKPSIMMAVTEEEKEMILAQRGEMNEESPESEEIDESEEA